MKMMINTTSSTGNKDMQVAVRKILNYSVPTLLPHTRPTHHSTPPPHTQVTMEVSYLKSYIKMGKAGFACISGCSCEATQVDTHHTGKTSLVSRARWFHPHPTAV